MIGGHVELDEKATGNSVLIIGGIVGSNASGNGDVESEMIKVAERIDFKNIKILLCFDKNKSFNIDGDVGSGYTLHFDKLDINVGGVTHRPEKDMSSTQYPLCFQGTGIAKMGIGSTK